MADAYRQETGNSVMVIGWLLLLFSLAVVFFRSDANGIGRTTIDVIAVALVAGGIACNVIGYYVRGKVH